MHFGVKPSTNAYVGLDSLRLDYSVYVKAHKLAISVIAARISLTQNMLVKLILANAREDMFKCVAYAYQFRHQVLE